MEDKFGKMDKWMMNASREVREQRISRKELDAFHEEVMKKIAASQTSGWKLPFPGMMMAAGFSLAVILGAAFYLNQVRVVPEEKPVKAEVKLVTEPLVPAPQIKEPAMPEPISIPVISQAAPAALSQQVPASAPAVLAKEEDLLQEIEALKELGLWTEEDEEEAGIPVETAFAELENYFGEAPSQAPIPVPAS